jgi:alkanesulfonate monooxygenase SsuD/methylene tetrahydromethanopterin reductase-like flavin-dependent oxidoreductase (luciferase family)
VGDGRYGARFVALFGIRFDLRNPAFAGTTMSERYAAALDMAAWADDNGAVLAIVSEHHGSEDGYLPSPLTFAAAIAARTTRIHINVAAVIAPFYDPLRLAEDAAVVDLISQGRLSLVLANGYVPSELAMFDVPPAQRATRTMAAIDVLRQAWTGEPFEHRGRVVRVTPAPHQTGGPPINLGGSTAAVARRAARLALGFWPSTPAVWDAYRDEVVALGRPDPGPYMGGEAGFVHVATDPEAAWQAIAPHALHESNSYGRWAMEAGMGDAASYHVANDPEELRRSGQYRVLTPDALVAELQAAGPMTYFGLHPLMGGIPPALGWESLRLVEREVLPHLRQ